MNIKAIIILTFAAFPAFAAESVVKTCDTTVVFPGEPKQIKAVYEIYQNESGFLARVTNQIDGRVETSSDSVYVSEYRVRAGLDPVGQKEDLNEGEGLIQHAMTLVSDPVFEGAFTTGFNLSLVRHAKVFVVGNKSNIGMTAIVEARDEQGRNLGSFLGGFLVSPCM